MGLGIFQEKYLWVFPFLYHGLYLVLVLDSSVLIHVEGQVASRDSLNNKDLPWRTGGLGLKSEKEKYLIS